MRALEITALIATYVLLIYVTLFVLAYFSRALGNMPEGFAMFGAIAWPVTLLCFIGFVILIGPILLGIKVYRAGVTAERISFFERFKQRGLRRRNA